MVPGVVVMKKLFTLFFFIVAVMSNDILAEEVLMDVQTKETAIEQLHQLLAKSLDRADSALQVEGNFVPYAAVIRRDGVVKKIVLGKDKSLSSEQMLHVLRESLKKLAQKGGIAASAIYYTGAGAEGDEEAKILVVELEHSRGVALIRMTPYQMEGEKVLFGEAVETESELNVMVRPKDSSVPAEMELK